MPVPLVLQFIDLFLYARKFSERFALKVTANFSTEKGPHCILSKQQAMESQSTTKLVMSESQNPKFLLSALKS